jgi:RNA polymerase sigma-70 factor (ECF subfamily)
MESVFERASLTGQVAVPESESLARARRGDESAVTALVKSHRQRLIRIAGNMLHDRHEAEDVAQETFLKAFKVIGALRDDRAFASYLYKICVRLCMDRLRTRRAAPAFVDKAQASDAQSVEARVLVERLLQSLSPDLRMTLILRELEQMSYSEVSQAMNVPLGTVRSRLHAARERLRAVWREEMAL